MADTEPFAADPVGAPAVRGTLHRSARPLRAALVLGHGAGGDRDAPVLVALADAFAAAGLLVLRCDLPFRQARAVGPPSPRTAGLDRAGIRSAAAAARRLTPGTLVIGGHSYGGRQASILAAEDPAAGDGLLLLAYPLQPPRRPPSPRTGHFPELRVPTCFVHGTRDPFGTTDELDAARRLIPAPTTLITIEGAGHDLGFGRRTAVAEAARIASKALAFFGMSVR